MRTIAHLSDVHFGHIDPVVTEALGAEIRAAPPDLVLISGDLTKGARVDEFVDARKFVDSLGTRVICVPGNHDVSPYALVERFTAPFARYERIMGAPAEPFFHDDEIAVQGLNSARSYGWSFNWAHGRLSRQQVTRAAANLSALPKHIFKIVLLHHPVLEPPAGSEQKIVGRLTQATELLDAAGTDLILAGHLHSGKTGELRRSKDRAIMAIQAASATSPRLRGEPNAYNKMTIDGAGLQVDIRAWNGGAFETARSSRWVKDTGGWRVDKGSVH